MKLTFSTPEILTRAVNAGLSVHWQSSIYTVRGADLDNLFIEEDQDPLGTEFHGDQ